MGFSETDDTKNTSELNTVSFPQTNVDEVSENTNWEISFKPPG